MQTGPSSPQMFEMQEMQYKDPYKESYKKYLKIGVTLSLIFLLISAVLAILLIVNLQMAVSGLSVCS